MIRLQNDCQNYLFTLKCDIYNKLYVLSIFVFAWMFKSMSYEKREISQLYIQAK